MAICILVVDDDHDDLALFSEALMIVRPEAIFSMAENGTDAVQYLNTQDARRPAIIFLDINMPGMNGWSCISELKSSPVYNDIPVVIYTTSSTKADQEKASQLGALCFVSKMPDFKSLKKMLEIVVENLEKNTVHLICSDIHKLAVM